jgi:hypothetical protein
MHYVAPCVLHQVSDKELEFNGQLSRELTWRSNEVAIADSVTEIVKTMQVGVIARSSACQ